MVNVDTGYTADRFAFDSEVTRVFDDMLKRSIPNYEGMRDITSRLISKSLPDKDGTLLDLGSSQGETIARVLKQQNFDNLNVLGYEISEPMLESSRERFSDMDNIKFDSADLRKGLPSDFTAWFDVISSILTMIFIPMEHRPHLLADIFKALKDDGKFFLVEKIIGGNYHSDSMFVEAYYDMKKEHGYTEDDVQRKRLALEGVLVPLSAKANEHMIKDAGFKNIETIWAWGNFRGWIITK
jgi:tRNA (cmo5U34)-methyltransferase